MYINNNQLVLFIVRYRHIAIEHLKIFFSKIIKSKGPLPAHETPNTNNIIA